MDINAERNQNYIIRPGRNIISHRSEVGEFEGVYSASKTYPAIWYIQNQKYLSCGLEKELNIPNGTVVRVKGQLATINRQMPSGKQYQARVLKVESSESLAEPLESKVLDDFRGHGIKLMGQETGLRTLEAEESEISVIQKVMWDSDHHHWVIGHFMHPPLKKMGSALYTAVDKQGKPLKTIISQLKTPVLE